MNGDSPAPDTSEDYDRLLRGEISSEEYVELLEKKVRAQTEAQKVERESPDRARRLRGLRTRSPQS